MKRDAFPLIFGVLVTSVIAGTLVIAGLKAGISPGTSPLVILFTWGAFTRRIAAGDGSRFLNIAQVAGSAGMAVCVGVIFTAPILQILYIDKAIAAVEAEGVVLPAGEDHTPRIDRELLAILEEHGHPVPPVDVPTLMLLSLAGALIGFGFVGLGTRRFLTDPTLPAPEARACETLIDTAVARPEERPRLGPSMYLGLVAGFAAPLLVKLGLAMRHVTVFSRTSDAAAGGGEREFQLQLPFNPIYLGIGGLLTFATAILVFGGSFLRLIGDFFVAGFAPGSEAARLFPENSMRWLGGAAMTVAVAYSLYRFMGVRAKGAAEADPLVEVSAPRRKLLGLCIALGMLIIIGWLLASDGATSFTFAMSSAILACCSLMVVLGAILSLQIGSSASPVSGTIFVTTLVLCLVALAVHRREMSDVVLLTPLLVGACVAVCTANDSSQDYKTLQLCGLPVQTGFLAQFLGLLAGCVVVPIILSVAHEAYVLGSPNLNAPQGKMFATLIDGLLLQSELPLFPIFIGLAIGALAVAMDIVGSRRGVPLPSMALAVGIYLPAYLGIGILIGSLFRNFAERGRRQSNESILTAAGFITGAALFELLLGFMIVFGFREQRLDVFHAPHAIKAAVALLGILLLAGVLYLNSRPRRPAE